MPATAPYGSWRSPVTAELIVDQAVAISGVVTAGGEIYWNERRPADHGRQVIVRQAASGAIADVLPTPYSARTTAHEYGGQSFAVGPEGTVYFTNFEDQRVYRLDGPDTPVALTAEPVLSRGDRYADLTVAPDGSFVLCVRERHDGDRSTVTNDVVAIWTNTGAITVLASGADFYLAPRLSPDGRRLAYLSWDHPHMPWDETRLAVVAVASGERAGEPELVAGGPGESVSQPRFFPDGTLAYLSDRSGYANCYREDGAALYPVDADCGLPDWVFGQSSYVIDEEGRLVVCVQRAGRMQLALCERGSARALETTATYFTALATRRAGELVAVTGSARDPLALETIDLETGEAAIVRPSRGRGVDEGYVSEPRSLTTTNDEGLPVHSLYYPPKNADFQGSPGERPPLIVRCHGGPTTCIRQVFDPEVQYFTSRGFAFVDVDYGGSSGHGRAYRERIAGRWGEVDVEDCQAVAGALADRGRVDRRRLVVRGSSAGGYTALCCLTFGSLFAAGAIYYGISDLSALARETHKFEAHYTDTLVGPYPEAAARYRERSPLFNARRLKYPAIFFHGTDDAVVPPEQADAMVAAMHERGIPSAYLTFEGEGHGFRRAETITRAIEAELYFYGRVLDIEVADEITPVQILDSSLLIH